MRGLFTWTLLPRPRRKSHLPSFAWPFRDDPAGSDKGGPNVNCTDVAENALGRGSRERAYQGFARRQGFRRRRRTPVISSPPIAGFAGAVAHHMLSCSQHHPGNPIVDAAKNAFWTATRPICRTLSRPHGSGSMFWHAFVADHLTVLRPDCSTKWMVSIRAAEDTIPLCCIRSR